MKKIQRPGRKFVPNITQIVEKEGVEGDGEDTRW